MTDSRERVLGIVGRLVTSPLFLAETVALRLGYEALPKGGRPPWPLVRAWRHSPQAEGQPAGPELSGPELSEFGRRLKEHLDRWGLMQLADWHLPMSQGLIIPRFMPPGAPAEPTHGVSLTVPVQFHLQNSDNIRAMIECAQKDAGLPAELAAISNHRQYAQIFRLHQMEAVLRSRWPEPPSSGSEGLIELAAEALLKLKKSQVRLIRTWMRQLRSGDRTKIPSGDR